ncbi:MAG: hypothetical protein DME33_06075 [Verrucomicrobia bacterium]|nr:MAG: hypothetical protein DME33_06075 [Verrucomicrobiota bacterium]
MVGRDGRARRRQRLCLQPNWTKKYSHLITNVRLTLVRLLQASRGRNAAVIVYELVRRAGCGGASRSALPRHASGEARHLRPTGGRLGCYT